MRWSLQLLVVLDNVPNQILTVTNQPEILCIWCVNVYMCIETLHCDGLWV